MKKVIIFLLIITSFSSYAQNNEKAKFKRFSLDLYGGIPIAYTDIKNEFFGYNTTARLNWYMTSAVSIGGEFSYGNVIGQDDNFSKDYFINTYMKAMLGGDVYFFNPLRFHELSNWFQPYAGINLGAVKSNIELSGNDKGLNEMHYNNWDFAHQWSVGAKFKLAKWLDLNARYSAIFIMTDNFDNDMPKNIHNKYNDALTTVDLGFTVYLGSKGKNPIIWNPATGNLDELATKVELDSMNRSVKLLDEKLKTINEELENTKTTLTEAQNSNEELSGKINILNDKIVEIEEDQTKISTTQTYPTSSTYPTSNLENSVYDFNPNEPIHMANLRGPLDALYYVVSGSYVYQRHADKRVNELRNMGYNPVIMVEDATQLKRVVIDSSNDLNDIQQKVLMYKENLDQTAWIIQQK